MIDLEVIGYSLIPLILIAIGIGVKHYLKWANLNDPKRFLGLSIYWFKLLASFLIIAGSLSFFTIVYLLIDSAIV
ncbi:hypothetical protein BXY85_0720 [Roseivirga pacifica]|uniref:Uncharacterized protein n=1 Tax=Roseivirga pacifica TaxID=1267423 RepID=A0A1I0RJ47_9BACT|nr:hypothetical protein BXY85_0720 [Roseivirga pacifica]SEW41010.1 hypothetical protein SAMN05216290_3666 [Roseivirga pacifica]